MFESLLSWILRSATSAFDTVLSTVTTAFAMDMGVFAEFFPAVGKLYYIIRAIALGLVFGIATINLLKYFFAPLNKVSETPLLLLVRTFAAIGGVYFGGYILDLIVNVFKGPYSALLNSSVGMQHEGLFQGMAENISAGFSSDITTGAANIICLYAIIALGINILKFILEFAERWVMVGVLTYTAPLGWCTLASQSTTSIFQKWWNMFISQCLMMLISAWSIKILLSCLYMDQVSTSSIANSAAATSTNVLFRIIAALAFSRVAQRFDSYIQQLGLNATTTGGSLLDEIVSAGRLAGNLLHKGGGSGGRHGADDDGSVLGAQKFGAGGVGGYIGAATKGLSVGGAAGAAAALGMHAAKRGTARVKGAAEGFKQGFNASEGESGGGSMNLLHNMGEGAKQGWSSLTHTAKGEKDKILGAMAKEDAGDTSAMSDLTSAERDLARQYRADREKEGNPVLPENPNDLGEMRQEYDGEMPYGCLDEQAKSEGFFEEEISNEEIEPNEMADIYDDDGEVIGREAETETVICSKNGEGYTGAFVEKNLEGATEKQSEILNNTTRHLSDSEVAMNIDLSKMKDQKKKETMMASTMVSSGIGGKSFNGNDNITAMDKEIASDLSAMSRGQFNTVKTAGGGELQKIQFDGGKAEWHKEETKNGTGHSAQFTHIGSDNVRREVNVFDQKMYDHYKQSGQMGKDYLSTARSFTDRNGNVRYMVVGHPESGGDKK